MALKMRQISSYQETIDGITRLGDSLLAVTPSTIWADEINRRILRSKDTPVASMVPPAVVSINDLIRSTVLPERPVINGFIKRLLVARAAETLERKFFKRVSTGMVASIVDAISRLKQNLIAPDELEEILSSRGSIREADLLGVYRNYESLLSAHGLFDEDDLWRLFSETWQPGDRNIWLVGFDRPTPFFKKIFGGATFTNVTKIPVIAPEVFSLNSPLDEADFVAERIREAVRCNHRPEDVAVYLTHGDPFIWDIAFALARRGLVSLSDLPYAPHRSICAMAMLSDKGMPDHAHASEFVKIATEKLKALEGQKTDPAGARSLKYISHANDSLKSLSYWFTILADNARLTRDQFKEMLRQELSVSGNVPDGLPFRTVTWNEAGLFGEKLAVMPRMNDKVFPQPSSRLLFFSEPDTLSATPDTRIDEIFEGPEESLRSLLKKFRLAASGKSVITYHTSDENGADSAPSPFIIKFEAGTVPSSANSKTPTKDPMCGTDLGSTNVVSALKADLKNGHFSATKLEEYASCPFVYFCKYILGIEPKEDITPEVQPHDRGTVIHLVLELFFTTYGNIYVSKNKPSFNLRTAVVEVVEKAFKTADLRGRLITEKYSPEMVAHFKRRTVTLITSILESEALHLKETTQRPTLFEMDFFEPLRDGFVFKGKIDRVDADEDTFTVIDYKTGRVDPIITNIERGLELQVPIYTEMARRRLKKRPAAAYLYAIRKGERAGKMVCDELKGRVGVKKRTGTVVSAERFEELIAFGVAKAIEYAERILAGRFKGEPDECKTYCDYKDTCRACKRN
jgi:RecB family exonuclease